MSPTHYLWPEVSPWLWKNTMWAALSYNSLPTDSLGDYSVGTTKLAPVIGAGTKALNDPRHDRGQEPGTQSTSPIWVAVVQAQDHYQLFPRLISRELVWKQSIQDSIQHSKMRFLCCKLRVNPMWHKAVPDSTFCRILFLLYFFSIDYKGLTFSNNPSWTIGRTRFWTHCVYGLHLRLKNIHF